MPSFDTKPTLAGPHRPVGFYVPRFRNLKDSPQSKDFVRGYGFEGDTQIDFNWTASGFGEPYKKSLREPQTQVSVTGFGEVLPRWDNFVALDKSKVDAFGIPVLRIQMSNGPNETAMIKDIAASAGELLEAGGAKNIHTYADPPRGRWAVHEAGIARMGSDPKRSVLTQFQQTHDVKNVFVMDAAGFPSNPCQNPTLTIMALCVRSCDFLMDEMKKGNV
jgi:choline dehydrogenase-like flavoprotein